MLADGSLGLLELDDKSEDFWIGTGTRDKGYFI